jgi:hypothetical protein
MGALRHAAWVRIRHHMHASIFPRGPKAGRYLMLVRYPALVDHRGEGFGQFLLAQEVALVSNTPTFGVDW